MKILDKIKLKIRRKYYKRKFKDIKYLENENKFIDEIFSDNTNIFVDDDKFKYKFLDFSRNKNCLFVLLIITFLLTSITVIKAFVLRSKVDDYEEFFIEITNKESEEIQVYNTNGSGNNNIDKADKSAAYNYIECINKQIDVNDLDSSVTDVINEINDFYNKSYNYFSYKYIDLYTGFSVSYNEHQQIFAASTIKAPTDIYVFEMASLGKIDLNNTLIYTSNYYDIGSGVLKNKEINTSYNIHTLLNYSTIYSDNAAHNMLEDYYGRENMLNFWKEKGTEAIFVANNNWGANSAYDAGIYMQELYNFYLTNNEYAIEAMNNFLNSSPKLLSNSKGYKVAGKSGWSGSVVHDVAIVFADNPYVVVALSNLFNTGDYQYYFNTVSELTEKLHTEYWKYKMDTCNNINQY